MERLGKVLPACVSRACYARSSKNGLSYCKWKGYVNCFSGEFRQTRCSCIASKQWRREYRTVRNDIQTSSHILTLKSHDGMQWVLLRPKQGGCEAKRLYSSSEDSGKDEKNDEREEILRDAGHYQIAKMLFIGGSVLLWFLNTNNSTNLQHVRWEEFEQEYLLTGRVRQVDVYSSYSGRPVDVAVVKLHLSAASTESEVIVDTAKGEFLQNLEQFESRMQVSPLERISRRIHTGSFWGEDANLQNAIVNGLGLLSFLMFVTAYRLGRGHIRRQFGLYQQRGKPGNSQAKNSMQDFIKEYWYLMKQDPATRQKNVEEMMKRRAAATEESSKRKYAEDKQTKKHDASKTEEEKKETFADMVRESIFQDKKFKIKRGDLIMKDELSMKDVAGLHEPKVEVIEFIDYVKNPERFQILGAKTPRGALLLGPPGCGKTLLAKALAAECGVPFYFIAASELDDMIVGVGAQRVRSLFKKAREQSPCIIYIDELDAIGMRRAATDKGQSNNDKEMTLNQLLAEMDGMHSREGVIILASTNRADMLDKALLRPGRFDRHISIDLPTFKERIEHFDLYLSKLSLNNPISTYSTRLAQLTPGMSGADIANVCNEAAIHAARNNQKKVMAKDFEYAVERKIAGAAKATNTVGVFEKKVIAYHESGHALVGWMLEHTDALLKVTIVPRTSGVGGFAQYLPQENKLYSKEHLFDIMCMALGGRVAENVIFDHLSTGAQDDLRRVTNMAYTQIRSLGMSESFGLVSYPEDQQGLKPFSKQVQHMLDLEARQLVSRAHQHTVELLMKNKDKLHKLAGLLLEKETISAQDVEDLIGPPPFGEKQMFDPIHFYDDELRSAEKTTEKK